MFLGSVIDLRAKNWGRESPPAVQTVNTSTSSTLSAEAVPFQYNAVFNQAPYSADEQVLAYG
jgi:hypothetical protein